MANLAVVAAVNLSLVIPTRNRAAALEHTLRHLEAQQTSRDEFEICVVDDCSEDHTGQLLREWSERLPLRYWRLGAPSGTSVARNLAIHEARGRHIVFIDDDVLTPPDFLQRHAGWLVRQPDALIRGPVVNVEEPPAVPSPPLRQPWRHYSRNYLCTSNASIPRHLLLRAGLFDPRFRRWEDAELGVRLKRLGVSRVWDAQTYVYHWKPVPDVEQRRHTARLDGQAAARLYKAYPSLRLWLRSGLHLPNRLRNRLLLAQPWLPASWRSELQVEQCYLDAGLREMRTHD